MIRSLSARLRSALNGCRINRRLFYSDDVEDKYLELLQLKDIKSEEFYDLHSEKRIYFYYIDLQGRLFLENTRPKNIATSLKSAKFLRFFFSQLRPNRTSDGITSSLLEYPYQSPCGHEMNYIKCADRPIVFDDLRLNQGTGQWELAFNSSELTMPFQPKALKISQSTGRLYHPASTKHFQPPDPLSIGLVRSQLAVDIARSIQMIDDPENASVIGEYEWEGTCYPIHRME